MIRLPLYVGKGHVTVCHDGRLASPLLVSVSRGLVAVIPTLLSSVFRNLHAHNIRSSLFPLAEQSFEGHLGTDILLNIGDQVCPDTTDELLRA